MTYDDHANCDSQLNEAEDKILNLKGELKDLKTENDGLRESIKQIKRAYHEGRIESMLEIMDEVLKA